MSALGHRLVAYGQLARISNLPTCWSAAFAGLLASPSAATVTPRLVGLTALGISLLYVGGMALNDWLDQRWDAIHENPRPLVRGVVTPVEAMVVAFGSLVSGSALLLVTAPATLPWLTTLLASIVLYNVLHKRLAVATLFMGACRALIYPLAAVVLSDAGFPRVALIVGVAVGLYTIALTLVARREHDRAVSTNVVIALVPGVFILLGLAVNAPVPRLPLVLAVGLFLVWMLRSTILLTIRPPRPKLAIMGWLAGLCLADACFIALTADLTALSLPLGCFIITTQAHRVISGT